MTLPLRIELAMTFKAVFPDVLARDRSGHGRPEASEAVSGCNILILAVDASILPAFWAARIALETAGFGGHYFRLGAGKLIVPALFLAKSAGIENLSVLVSNTICQSSTQGSGWSSPCASNDRLSTR